MRPRWPVHSILAPSLRSRSPPVPLTCRNLAADRTGKAVAVLVVLVMVIAVSEAAVAT